MRGWIRSAVALFAFFIVGFAATYILRPNAVAAEPRMRYDDEIAVVLLVSPTCAASRNPDLPAAWNAIGDSIAKTLSAKTSVAFIGVALSAEPKDGLEFLDRFGTFDEQIVGRGAYNTGAMAYMQELHRGPAVLPQIVVLRRHYTLREDGTRFMASEVVVRRLWGFDDITSAARKTLAL